MTDVLTTSQSEINTFRTCRWKWWARYDQGLRPKRDAEPLTRGRVVHAGIEAAYRYQSSYNFRHGQQDPTLAATEAALKEALRIAGAAHVAELDDEQGQQVHDWLGIVERFVVAFVIADLERYRVVDVERRFELRLRNARGTRQPYLNVGAVDVVLLDPEYGSLIVGEHKTTSGDCHTMDARLDVDPQTPGYVWALQQMAIEGASSVGRVFLSCIRTKGESVPKVNKDGTVSAAAVDCTSETYQRALHDQEERTGKPVTAKQVERAHSLPTRTDRWASRHEWFYAPQEVERWATEHLADARLIRQARTGRLPVTRNGAACFPQNASPCPYRAVCVQDAPEIRAELYEVDHTRGGRS